ncbi:MAG: hypothetical protein KY466_15000 [Gemmatimonadetes bacterium]|nr:hypothetical protein [Gemmatimonadota bacterium]
MPRGGNWSREEVEATAASYFAMLEHGLRGESFNKAEHRRALLPLLDGQAFSLSPSQFVARVN